MNRSKFAERRPRIMDKERLRHTKWYCKYHVVWIPKYRKYKSYTPGVAEGI